MPGFSECLGDIDALLGIHLHDQPLRFQVNGLRSTECAGNGTRFFSSLPSTGVRAVFLAVVWVIGPGERCIFPTGGIDVDFSSQPGARAVAFGERTHRKCGPDHGQSQQGGAVCFFYDVHDVLVFMFKNQLFFRMAHIPSIRMTILNARCCSHPIDPMTPPQWHSFSLTKAIIRSK